MDDSQVVSGVDPKCCANAIFIPTSDDKDRRGETRGDNREVITIEILSSFYLTFNNINHLVRIFHQRFNLFQLLNRREVDQPVK